MSKPDETDAEVRPSPQDTPVDAQINNTSGESKKPRSSKSSDRIMIFNKED
jgi:hypothetical protein